MDPFIQYTGFPLFWIYFSSLFVFLFGIWQTKYLSRSLSISQKKGLSIYIWHTFFCVIHFLWVLVVKNDVFGTYVNSLDLSFDFGSEQYLSNIFILNFYRIFSYYLKFSFFTTFLVMNIIGSNAILLIEYFFQKNSKNYPRIMKFILGSFIWLPTLHFWTVLGKDALMILGILLIIFSLERINKRYIYAIPALIVVTCLRSYISIMIVMSLIFSIIFTTYSLKQSSKIMLTFFSFLALILISPLVNQFIFGGDFDGLNSIIERFSYNVNVTSLGTYSIPPDLNPFLRVFAYSFRPLFYDVKNLFGFITSFDNAILLIIFIFSIISIFLISDLKLSISNQFPIFCATFSLSISFLLAQSTSNLGIAARHKFMFIPVGFILILMMFRGIYEKKQLNSKKGIPLYLKEHF